MGWKKKWSQSLNPFLLDHYHYVQSVLCIIRGVFLALQKLSLIICYLQIAADLHSTLWWNEGLATHCINIISTLSPITNLLIHWTVIFKMFFKSIHLFFLHPHMFYVKAPIHHLSVLCQEQIEISHTRQKQTLKRAFKQMLHFLPWGSDTDAYSKYFFVPLFKNVQQSYNKG